MPVELTAEEQTKFDAVLKERGYDEHAAEVIKKRGEEAKQHREAREKAESELKTLREANEKRTAEEAKLKAEQDAKQKQIDDEKKTLDERLADMRKEIAAQFEGASKAQKAELDALVKQIKERDQKSESRDRRSVEKDAIALAKDRGFIDPTEIAKFLDLSTIKVDDGEPDAVALEKLFDEHAKAKPHLYEKTNSRSRDESGRFSRPDPSSKPKGGVDWSKLTDKEFEEHEERLRAGKL